MSPFQWIAAVALAGAFGISAYLVEELRSVNGRLEKLDGVVQNESNARAVGIEGLQASLRAESDRISSLGTPEIIAARIIEASLPQIVDLVAEKLVNDPTAIERLRGPQGLTPPLDQIAEALIDADIAVLVSDAIWSEHQQQIALLPKLVSTVAESVFVNYGEELRGADGRSPDPAEVAAALAAEPAFLTLIELSRKP